jgi:hypothetical protein
MGVPTDCWRLNVQFRVYFLIAQRRPLDESEHLEQDWIKKRHHDQQSHHARKPGSRANPPRWPDHEDKPRNGSDHRRDRHDRLGATISIKHEGNSDQIDLVKPIKINPCWDNRLGIHPAGQG